MTATTARTLTPFVARAGYEVATQPAPHAGYDYAIGTVVIAGGETIEFRWWGGLDIDARGVDLHISPDSPRGSIRQQIEHYLRSRGAGSVSFQVHDSPVR